jgi:type IV pilus assembly protein PilM
MFERTILGLDIGSYSIKAVELRASLRAVNVVRCCELVLPGKAPAEELDSAAQLFFTRQNLSRETVISALPSDRITQRRVRLPFRGKQVSQALRFEIEEGLPFPLDKMILCYEEAPAGTDATDALALLAPREEVKAHLEGMARLGIEPRHVENEGTVLGNLATFLGITDAARLLLDIGHRKTNVVLLSGGKPIVLRSIPIAGRHLNEALARDLRLDDEAAVEHKHENGVFAAGTTQPLTAGIGVLLDQLVREAVRSVQSVASDPQDPRTPREILLAGGSAALLGLPEYFEEKTGIPCRVLSVPRGVEGATGLARAAVPIFAQATALALRGAGSTRSTRSDFRQDEFAYVPDLSGLRPQLQLTTVLFAVLLLLWPASYAARSISASSRAGALEDNIGALYSAALPGQPVPADPMKGLEDKYGEVQDLANHLGVTGLGQSPLELLREISSRIPPELEITLQDLQLERNGIKAQGCAPNFETVDRVKVELSQVPTFEDVQLADVGGQQRRGRDCKSFTLSIRIRRGA